MLFRGGAQGGTGGAFCMLKKALLSRVPNWRLD
jgi:hypothetical protein